MVEVCVVASFGLDDDDDEEEKEEEEEEGILDRLVATMVRSSA